VVRETSLLRPPQTGRQVSAYVGYIIICVWQTTHAWVRLCFAGSCLYFYTCIIYRR